MFSTKNLILEETDVPSYWVFQYYLDLPEQLTGQDIKINSIFNPNDKTPSFCIYVDKTIMQYKFKDFSTGIGGNKSDLVRHIFKLGYPQATRRIIEDYNKYIQQNGKVQVEFVPQAKWEIDFIKYRPWNKNDTDFWLPFRIGKTLLERYNVKPIEYFNMVKEEELEIESLKIGSKHCYGYFDKHGDVFKIYQPYSKKHKFHKVKSYIQGIDQLEYKEPYLVICSSLKDAMCLKGMGYNLEVISPDSENTMIKPHIIANLKKKFKNVITIFDNDDAGRHAVKRYAEAYGINGCTPTVCKDISDAMKEIGFDKTHAMLKPLLKQTLNK
tara:strand:+ start:821 stop:1798 length:978 start_codon:yes stop_codon:yes gene_type:complete